jgi:hypothetical protein
MIAHNFDPPPRLNSQSLLFKRISGRPIGAFHLENV